MCLAYFEIYKQQIEKILSPGKNSDILRFRSYIFDRIKDLTDKKTGFLLLDSFAIGLLRNISNIVSGIADSELQIIAIFMSDFPDYLYETLKKNNLAQDFQSLITFEEFIKSKEPKYFLDIDREVDELEESGTYSSKDRKYLENILIATYINEYEIFDNLYYFFRDTYFGVQIPNPFPGLIFRIEMQALKFHLFEINITKIKGVLLNPLNESNIVKHNNKKMTNVYFYGIYILNFT